MAEQLYLAVEHRCNLDHLQLDIPGGCNKNTFLEMDDNLAEQYLTQSLVRSNYGKETIRFNGNFENGKESLSSGYSLHLF